MTLERSILWILVSAFLSFGFALVGSVYGVPNAVIGLGGFLISVTVLGYFLDEAKREKEKSGEASSKDRDDGV